MNEKILQQISRCRKQKNISISELAEKANISYSYLYQLENNRKVNPSLEILDKIANALEMDISLLFIK